MGGALGCRGLRAALVVMAGLALACVHEPPPMPPDPGEAAPAPSRGETDARRADFVERLGAADFEALHEVRGGVAYVKLVVVRHTLGDLTDDVVYFFDPGVYPLHVEFVRRNHLIPNTGVEEIQRETWTSEERRFFFANLSRYETPAGARWALETFEQDRASPALLAELFEVVRPASWIGPELVWKPNSLEQAALRGAAEARGVGVLENDTLGAEMPFLVQNAGRPAVGRLRVVESSDPITIERMLFNRDEIPVLQTIPNDITRVAGIITTQPTTPLSHVNLRASTWQVPNVMIRDALSRIWQEGWDGAWVYLAVGDDGVPVLRAASAAEIAAAQAAPVRRDTRRIPRVDLSREELRPLDTLRAADVPVVGAKAANLGELTYLARRLSEEVTLRGVAGSGQGAHVLPGQLGWSFAARMMPARGPRSIDGLLRLSARQRAGLLLADLDVPPGFVVPFATYVHFLQMPENAPITAALDAALADPQFHADAPHRQARLAEIRALIQAGAFPPADASAVLRQLRRQLGDRPVFVRSSTNSEDLPGFSGAGLYDTVADVSGDEALLLAIQRVWASVWNFHAYEAREDAGIDHRSVYPAALVQEAVHPDAAGVLITRDVFAPAIGGRAYLNANPGPGVRVVQTGIRPEQIYVDLKDGAVRRVSLSEATGAPVLTDAVARRLAWVGGLVEAHFAWLAGVSSQPQDVEWLLVGDHVYIVQARPWSAGGRDY